MTEKNALELLKIIKEDVKRDNKRSNEELEISITEKVICFLEQQEKNTITHRDVR